MAVVVMGGDSLGWTLDRADTLDTSALQITHPLIDSAGSPDWTPWPLDTVTRRHAVLLIVSLSQYSQPDFMFCVAD